MKSVEKEKLRKILMKNARLFKMTIKDKKDGYFMKEDFHLFTLTENEIFSWDDYCYECYLPEFLLEYEKELEEQHPNIIRNGRNSKEVV